MEFYDLDDLDDEIFPPSEPPVPMPQSSFVPYTKPSVWYSCTGKEKSSTRPNAHKRMIDFLRRIPINKANYNTTEFENDKNYRHKIKERLRREMHRNTFDALHSLLPPRTKKDRYSILQTAALNLRELKQLKEHLHKRNHELENNVSFTDETRTFRLRRPTPASGIDSMIGVLTTMKNMGLKARSIHTEFSHAEFSAVIETEQKIEAATGERAVESALQEIERKFVYESRRRKGVSEGDTCGF